MDYGRDWSIMGTSKGRKLEEITFSETVLRKGIQTRKDMRYALQRSTKSPVNVRLNTNTRTFQEVGKVCV